MYGVQHDRKRQTLPSYVTVRLIKFYGHCNIGNILNGKLFFFFFGHEFEKITEVVLFTCVSWSSVLFFLLTGKGIVSSVEKKEVSVLVRL